jgi:hypothetical protein
VVAFFVTSVFGAFPREAEEIARESSSEIFMPHGAATAARSQHRFSRAHRSRSRIEIGLAARLPLRCLLLTRISHRSYDFSRLPIPKRVTAPSSRLAPWGRFPHISGRRRFEDDRDGPVPGMSHTGAGRVALPGLGVGGSRVSIALRSVSSSFPLSRRAPDGVHRLAGARQRRGRPVVSALDCPTAEC